MIIIRRRRKEEKEWAVSSAKQKLLQETEIFSLIKQAKPRS